MEFKDLTEQEQKLVFLYKYDLFRDKVIVMKERGVDSCKLDSRFDMKGAEITDDARALLKLVIPQIIDYKGLTFERPLEGIKIHGFYYFMHLFFFKRKRQIASFVDGFFLDKMLMKNSITGDEIWLINKVPQVSKVEIEKYMKK
tara:strand:+ start:38 stop:469 length:432 start_codon:yes stop_codon:yes gene_type:complete